MTVHTSEVSVNQLPGLLEQISTIPTVRNLVVVPLRFEHHDVHDTQFRATQFLVCWTTGETTQLADSITREHG